MGTKTSVFLQANHISKKVQSGNSEIQILENVNLSINQGDSIAILGSSGSGKTTLLTLLAGLDSPTTGSIYFKKYQLDKLSEEERALIRAKEVGFIFQSFYLLPTLSALENVMLPLEIQYQENQYIKSKAEMVLNQVGLTHRMHHYPNQLSGGEQQRVAIARAFVNEPEIIFADEMTGNLDTHTGEIVSQILFTLNKNYGTTLVLVTHDEKLANQCHQKYKLQEGKIFPC